MLKSWKDHKFITFQHELWRPFLSVWMFFKDILMYVFDLFKISWQSLPLAMNKNAIIPSFIASFFTCFLGFFLWFVVQILVANDIVLDFGSPDSLALPAVVFLIIVALPMCWGFSTVASVIKAKELSEDDSWKNHAYVGNKGIRFFLTYVMVVLFLLISIIALSGLGVIPMLGKPLLALLAVPFYFGSIIIFLSILGLVIGVHLFGGFYLSGDYDESSTFLDKTKSLFKMVGSKIIDFVAIQLPAHFILFLFVIIPVYIMMIAVDIMQFPGREFYDIRWPNVYSSLANTNQYPAKNFEEDAGMLKLYLSSEYPWKYPTIQDAEDFYSGTNGVAKKLQDMRKNLQDGYTDWKDKDSSNKAKNFDDYIDYRNSISNIKKYSNSKGKLVMLSAELPGAELPNQDDGSCYVSKDKIECVSQYDSNHIWRMDNEGKKLAFGGEWHPSFFIWLTSFILIFVCSFVISVPLGCFYSAKSAIFYKLYNTDYNNRFGLIKRLIVIAIPIFFILSLSGGSVEFDFDSDEGFEFEDFDSDEGFEGFDSEFEFID